MWREGTVQVSKNLGEIYHKQLRLPLNWALIYRRKIFLLTTLFHSSLFFSSSLTWFSPYFIYLGATHYLVQQPQQPRKLSVIICSSAAAFAVMYVAFFDFKTIRHPPPKNIIRFLTNFHNHTQLFMLPSSSQALARTHTMRRWTDFKKKSWVFLGGLYAM